MRFEKFIIQESMNLRYSKKKWDKNEKNWKKLGKTKYWEVWHHTWPEKYSTETSETIKEHGEYVLTNRGEIVATIGDKYADDARAKALIDALKGGGYRHKER